MSSERQIQEFQEKVWAYYAVHRREMPWRVPEPDGSYDPYKILVGEIMLQQTQTQRVIPKYLSFIDRYPDIEALAGAELGEVLKEWSGLGYNRRAKYLHEAAGILVKANSFPSTLNALSVLPGVGKNTAAAVLVYAFNQPLSFIETNIRTVYIYHFFAGQTDISDKQILALVEKTLPREEQPESRIYSGSGAMNSGSPQRENSLRSKRNPEKAPHYREWYWALMDYGTHLKKTVGNLSRSSKHYTRQSRFEGSRRQIRGRVLKLLADRPYPLKELALAIDDGRLTEVLEMLANEGMIRQTGDRYRLA